MQTLLIPIPYHQADCQKSCVLALAPTSGTGARGYTTRRHWAPWRCGRPPGPPLPLGATANHYENGCRVATMGVLSGRRQLRLYARAKGMTSGDVCNSREGITMGISM